MKTLSAVVSIILFAAMSAGVSATPIHYVEDIDGPLNASTPLNLGVGTNIIEGSDCWTSKVRCFSVSDFVFNIQAGTELVNYRYSFGNLSFETAPPASWTSAAILRGLDDPSLMATTATVNWLAETVQTLSLNGLNWTEGTYRQFYQASRSGFGGTWDFRIELDVISTVTDIPLPATILIFGFGLGLAAFMRRRTDAA